VGGTEVVFLVELESMVAFNHVAALLFLVHGFGSITATMALARTKGAPLAKEVDTSLDSSSLLQQQASEVLEAPKLLQAPTLPLTPQAADTQSPSSPIPQQLVMTAKQASLEDMPQTVQDNVKHMLAESPGVTLRWLSDADCATYIHDHYDDELSKMFKAEGRGSFRGDICRAAVLAREGGFYLDLDVQMNVPIIDLVDDQTTFASSFTEDHRVLNAVIATRPGNPVIVETLSQIRKWYRHEAPHTNWMGPETMLRALKLVLRKDCNGQKISPKAGLEWKCGEQVFRFYQEQKLECSLRGSLECPSSRAQSSFDGLHFGLFVPGPSRQLVGWPRFAACSDWGCGAGGWEVRAGKVASVASL